MIDDDRSDIKSSPRVALRKGEIADPNARTPLDLAIEKEEEESILGSNGEHGKPRRAERLERRGDLMINRADREYDEENSPPTEDDDGTSLLPRAAAGRLKKTLIDPKDKVPTAEQRRARHLQVTGFNRGY